MEKSTFIIIQPCRDRSNFDKIYRVGEDVSGWDTGRIENAIRLGTVKEEVKAEDEKAIPAAELIAKIGEAQTNEELVALIPEGEARKTVLKAFEDRTTAINTQ